MKTEVKKEEFEVATDLYYVEVIKNSRQARSEDNQKRQLKVGRRVELKEAKYPHPSLSTDYFQLWLNSSIHTAFSMNTWAWELLANDYQRQ